MAIRSRKRRLQRKAERKLAKRQRREDLLARIGVAGCLTDSDNDGGDEISDLSSVAASESEDEAAARSDREAADSVDEGDVTKVTMVP